MSCGVVGGIRRAAIGLRRRAYEAWGIPIVAATDAAAAGYEKSSKVSDERRLSSECSDGE